MTIEEVRVAFTYHRPDDHQARAYETLRADALCTAESMIGMCPESRELSTALTKLREAVMWANAAIAIHGLRK